MTKEKQIRTYDPDGFRRRAASLCVRDSDESEIMLVTSSRAPEYWIVPGGGVEPNENPNDAAVREAEEEAGVKGVLKRSLGDIENVERKHRTSVYVLEVHEELDVWEDYKCRKRCWFSVKEALSLLSIYKPIQCTYVKLMIQTSPSVSLRNLALSYPIISSTSSSSSSRKLYNNDNDGQSQQATSNISSTQHSTTTKLNSQEPITHNSQQTINHDAVEAFITNITTTAAHNSSKITSTIGSDGTIATTNSNNKITQSSCDTTTTTSMTDADTTTSSTETMSKIVPNATTTKS